MHGNNFFHRRFVTSASFRGCTDKIMSTIIIAKPAALRFINALCVSVEDLGVIDTQYGRKPMVKFTFETDEVNEFGQKRRLTRLFHKHSHPKSALSLAVKMWRDRNLAAEEENLGEVDWQSFVDTPACLKLEPGIIKDGRRFEHIVEILALNDCELEATSEPEETK